LRLPSGIVTSAPSGCRYVYKPKALERISPSTNAWKKRNEK
jgi:hypothetical protein